MKLKINGSSSQCDPVAITGIGGRYPLSKDVDEFWTNLMSSKELYTEDDSRWPKGHMNLPKKAGKIPDVDKFDAEFFGMSNQDADEIDPQFKICHETTYEAILDAGLDPKDIRGDRTGMFVGYCYSDARMAQLQIDATINETKWTEDFSEVSKFFGFKGPCLTYDSACASSFSAFNEAVKLIQCNVIDTAIVAGVAVCTSPSEAMGFRQLGMTSDAGESKCLDKGAAGYVRSETICSIVLQRKSAAKRVYAKVLNSKTNSDGYKKEGITFPGQESMTRLMRETYDEVNLDPSKTKYIEAHITGTQAGDPIECGAIEAVFCPSSRGSGPILLGCLKSNMGHAEGASGVAAITKACQVFQKELIPPNVNYQDPNPNISGLFNGKLQPVLTPTEFYGDIISLNSFGFGGSNVHAIIEKNEEFLNENIHNLSGFKGINRLVLFKSRTEEAFELLKDKIENQKEDITTEFLDMIDNASRIKCPLNMLPWRGYYIIDNESKQLIDCKWQRVDGELKTKNKHQVNIFCSNPVQTCIQNVGNTIQQANVKVNYVTIKNGHQNGTKSVTIEVAVDGELKEKVKITANSSKDSILQLIGSLYIDCNEDVNLKRLYPAIKYPVSSSTASISPLIKWNHDDQWTVYKYPDFFRWTIKNKSFHFDYTSSFNHLTGHVIDGRIIFPAAQYLWTIWQSLALELIENSPVAFLESGVKFWNVKLLRAIIVNPGDEVFLITRVNHFTGFFEIIHGDTCLVTGHAMLTWNEKAPSCPDDMKHDGAEDKKMISKKDFYKELRVRGYDYEGDFQGVDECNIEGTFGIVSFLKNWVCFTDAVFQLTLINDNSRQLLLPTDFECLQVDANVFKGISGAEYDRYKNISKSATIDDGENVYFNNHDDTSSNQAKNIDEVKKFHVTIDKYTKEAFTEGLYIKNMAANPAPRKKVTPIVAKFNFVPFNQEVDEENIETESNTINVPIENDVIRHHFKIVADSFHSVSLKITEVNMSSLCDVKDDVIKGLTSFGPVVNCAEYTNMTLYPLSNIKMTLDTHLMIIQHPNLSSNTEQSSDEKEEIFDNFLSNTLATVINTGSFVMIIFSSTGKDEQFLALIENSTELQIISKKRYNSLNIFLIRKTESKNMVNVIIHEVETFSYKWVDELKTKIYSEEEHSNEKGIKTTSMKATDNEPIYLIAKNNDSNGLSGFLNCVRNEDERFRGIVIADNVDDAKANLIIKTCIKYDLKMAIFKNGQLGSILESEKDLSNDQQAIKSDGQVTESSNIVLDVETKGDLGSLKYYKVNKSAINNNNHEEVTTVDVHYSSLNFKDVMVASGRVPLSAYPSEFQSMTTSGNLGMEFSGIDASSGKRLMGMIPTDAIATKVVVPQNFSDFMFEVPNNMSLEEAATIPVAYSTVYYALVMRGKLVKGESVLIHAGSGGVGQAAIRVCLSMNCEVYTTVGSNEKRDFIKSMYPSIHDDHIFDSRSISFGDDLLRATDGRGVDVVLNSLSDEKLKVGLTCLAENGRFIEIGKYDLITNSSFDPTCLTMNQTFQAVCLAFFMAKVSKSSNQESKQLNQLMRDGLKSGVVKPLRRHIFDWNQSEDAFRFMANGKHTGKVLIKMIQNEAEIIEDAIHINNSTSSRRVTFDSSKSFILIGGLGGLGLEICYWLVKKGVRNLIITSRSGMKTAYHEFCIQRLKQFGSKVFIVNHDVSKFDQAAELIQKANSIAPVGGIFNLAMVLKDAMFENQTTGMFEDCCSIKIKGTQYLDEITRTSCPQLDHFVCFSSLVSTIGNAGQSNYAYANSFMDNLCQKRRDQGLPGLAIGWGAIGDVGHVAEKMGHDVVVAGTSPQRINSCFDVLEKVLFGSDAVVGSWIPVDMSKTINEGKNVLDIIMNVLGIKDHSKISPTSTLGDLGLDSLMAVEIKQILERKYEKILSTKEIREMTIDNISNITSLKQLDQVSNGHETKETENILSEELLESIKISKELFTKLNDVNDGDQVFIFPPIEGTFHVMSSMLNELTSITNRPLIGVNWILHFDSMDSVEDVSKYVLEEITKQFNPLKPLQFISYSFGSMIAMQIELLIQSSSEYKNLQVSKLVVLDFSPEYGRQFLNGTAAGMSPLFKMIASSIRGKYDEVITEIPNDDFLKKYFNILSKNANISEIEFIQLCNRVRKKSKMLNNYGIGNGIKPFDDSVKVLLIKASNESTNEIKEIGHEDVIVSGLKQYIPSMNVISYDGDHKSFLINHSNQIANNIREYLDQD